MLTGPPPLTPLRKGGKEKGELAGFAQRIRQECKSCAIPTFHHPRFALASFGKVRKVHETEFAVAFGRKSVALKRILDAAFESPSSPGEATFADLMDVLLAITFTPIVRLPFAPLFGERSRPAMRVGSNKSRPTGIAANLQCCGS